MTIILWILGGALLHYFWLHFFAGIEGAMLLLRYALDIMLGIFIYALVAGEYATIDSWGR